MTIEEYVKSKEKFCLMPFTTVYLTIIELIKDGLVDQNSFEKGGGTDVAVHKQKSSRTLSGSASSNMYAVYSRMGFDFAGPMIGKAKTSAKIIRTAARMANAFKAQFTALFVQTSSFEKTSLENKKRLKENIHLAEQLGAKIEMVVGEDIPFQIAEFARLAGVKKK